MSLIDPNLLQLVGLGSTGDADIADGRHLRWVFHRLLGFPRTSFRLTRRPSLLAIDFNAPPPGTPPIRSQLTRQVELGSGSRIRFPSGLTVSKTGGFVYGPADSGGQPLLRLDDRPMSLDFGAEGSPMPTSGELLSNPVAYALITIVRRSRTGFAVARGYYDGRPNFRLVDQAAIGSHLRVHLGDIVGEISTIGTVKRLLSSGERRLGTGAAVRRDALTAASVAGLGLRPRWPRPPGITDPNPYVTETLLLHGGLLEHIELRGHDANVLRVQWITTRDLYSTQGWTEFGRFYLPLTDAPDIYPAWTPDSGEKVAAERLSLSPPRRQAPWDREDGGDPAVLLPTVAATVAESLSARYLGAEFKPVDVAMREFLRGELQQVVPQALVQVTERLEPGPDDQTGPEGMNVTVSPFDLLYAASADQQVATLLGLATVDTSDPNGIYDYAVEAGFATAWVQWVLQPRLGRDRAERLRGELGGRLADWHERGVFTAYSIASVITGLRQTPAVALEPPADLRAEVIPDPTRAPVQARVRVHWAPGGANLFEAPDRTRVLHAFVRVDGARNLLLHHRDDESRLLAPHLPTPYGVPPRLNLVDRAIPSYGVHSWKVAAMDLFGRLSPAAAVTAEVRDTMPPPSPANAEAALLGDATAGPAWSKLVIGFDWLTSHETLAPDLAAFEVHVRQGPVSSADAPLPATWGRLETFLGAVAGPVRIAWPSLAVSGAPSGVTVDVSSAPLDVGGHRITVELSPIACPFDAGGYARLAAAIRAVDDFDNAGGFSVARAERVDLFVPPPPTFSENALRATSPDAQNRSWFRVPVPSIPDASVRVLRASSVALLSASGTSAADFDALGEPDQVGLLKSLAVTHREPFATDHEQPIFADGGVYLLELPGFDRGLTVVHLAVENRTGTRSTWPTSPAAFLVIAVPRDSTPPVPLIREIRVGERTVTLSIAADVTGLTRAFAVYRARTAADAADVRRMRPVVTVTLPDPAADAPTPVIDSGLYDEMDYFYRVVAIGEGGARSNPTKAARVTPVSHAPPPAPEVRSIERLGQTARRVTLLVPRRDYPVFLFRRHQYAAAWETPSGAGIGPDGRLDIASLTTMPDPAGYQVVLDDVVPADELYSYFARIEDPRGRRASGAPLTEAL
jgi:hypothetical protein